MDIPQELLGQELRSVRRYTIWTIDNMTTTTTTQLQRKGFDEGMEDNMVREIGRTSSYISPTDTVWQGRYTTIWHVGLYDKDGTTSRRRDSSDHESWLGDNNNNNLTMR